MNKFERIMTSIIAILLAEYIGLKMLEFALEGASWILDKFSNGEDE